jgi:Asp-tRNA(Asn)/Glu-tRNA(Gln) amidotransferase A subunit family amidase
MTMPLYKLTATHALELINNNTISVEAYAKSLLDRIEERDPTVKAWAYLDPASILSQAQSLDKIPVKERGRLHGVPIGIKDIMNTKGILEFRVKVKAYRL